MKEIKNLNVKINWGFVLRLNITDIEEMKEFIESLEDTTVIFSTVSGNRLYIKESEGGKNER